MLRGIPDVLSPELLKVLAEMGHGDEIVLADRNFPAASKARHLVRCDGIDICTLLKAMIPIFPLDEATGYNIVLMDVPDNYGTLPEVWKAYHDIIALSPNEHKECLRLKKPDFYRQSEMAYAIVATGEKSRFANVILRKGIISADEQ